MKKRIGWIDTFRAVMIFFIALGHTLSSEISGTLAIKTYIYAFHVPAFFFVSGYLFSAKGQNFIGFIKKKFKSLMVPYYVFSIVSILIFAVLGTFASDKLGASMTAGGLFPNILGMLYGNGTTGHMQWNLPLWFIPCLFITMIIFYPISILLSTYKKSRLSPLLMALFLILAVLNFYVFKLKTLPLGLETAIYMMPFFLGGYLFKDSKAFLGRVKKITKLILGGSLLICGAVMGLFANQKVEYVSSDYGNLFLFYISAALSVLAYMHICQTFSGKVTNILGQNTLSVLLMHKFPILFFQIILSFLSVEPLPLIILFDILTAALACLLSVSVGFAVKKICPALIGAKKENKIDKF